MKAHRHVIRPLGRVPVPGPLWRDAVQRVEHVGAHVGVPVLVEAQRAARVLREEVQQADAHAGELGGELALDERGDEVRAARARGEDEGLLTPNGFRHVVFFLFSGSGATVVGVVGLGLVLVSTLDYIVTCVVGSEILSRHAGRGFGAAA